MRVSATASSLEMSRYLFAIYNSLRDLLWDHVNSNIGAIFVVCALTVE